MDLAKHIVEHAILGVGVSSYNAGAVAITGGTIDGTVIGGTTPAAVNATTLGLGAASDVKVTRYAAKQVLISGDGTGATTNAGIIAGYGGATGAGAIYPSTVTPNGSINSVLHFLSNQILFGNSGAAGYIDTSSIYLRPGANNIKVALGSVEGAGPSITAGTATTDVAALSVTRTNNNAAVVKGVEFTFTDGTSAAGFLPLAIRGGAAGTTDLFKVEKAGNVRITGSFALAGGGATGFYDLSNNGAGLQLGASSDAAITRVSAGVIGVGTGATGSVAGTLSLNQIILSKTITTPGTTGAQTINKSSGRVNFAAAATSLVVTNSLVDANSIITGNIATADATAADPKIVAAAGSFTITLGAAPTAETAFDFRITN